MNYGDLILCFVIFVVYNNTTNTHEAMTETERKNWSPYLESSATYISYATGSYVILLNVASGTVLNEFFRSFWQSINLLKNVSY